MKIRGMVTLTGMLCMLSVAAVSQAAGPWYAGGGGGYSTTNAGAADMHPNLVSIHNPTATSVDDSSYGWKLFAGYQFNPNLAVEGSYTRLGTYTLDADITTPILGTLRDELKPDAWCLSGVGTLPVQTKTGITGRLGLCRWDDEFSGYHSDSSPEMDYSSGTDPLIGLGASYDVTPQLAVRLEWERYFNVIHDNKDADLFSLSAAWRF